MLQRNKTIQSNTVDPNKLEKKLRWEVILYKWTFSTNISENLKHISSRFILRSPSPSSSISIQSFNHEKILQRDLRIKRESYKDFKYKSEMLSHPVKFEFDILENFGEYKDILLY